MFLIYFRSFFDEEVIWRVLTQLLWAINDCHTHPKGKILHRDLKPANVFIDPKKNDIKIGDFGLARVMGDKTQFATTNVGTPYYMSPEQVNDEAYNHKCDVWSIGCTVYELAALSPPFEAKTHLALALKIKQGEFPRIPSRYSDELQTIIEKMLTLKASQRPSVADLLQHRQIALRVRELKVQNQ
jgi:serine/threonine protein kinase